MVGGRKGILYVLLNWEARMKFKKGDTHHLYLGLGKPYKIHIVAIIDREMVVYKWYGRTKQWWHYKIEHREILSMTIQRDKKRYDKQKSLDI